KGVPILEHLATIENIEERDKCWDVINIHEMKGAEEATLFPGVRELLNTLRAKGYHLGLLTRNSSIVTAATLEKFGLHFDIVLTRDDCRPKPDPDVLLIMAKNWNISAQQLIYIGDHLFDVETAENAKATAVLFGAHAVSANDEKLI